MSNESQNKKEKATPKKGKAVDTKLSNDDYKSLANFIDVMRWSLLECCIIR